MEESGVITTVLKSFTTEFNKGWVYLHPVIQWLAGTFLAIELTMTGLWWALGGGEQLVNMMKKLMYLLVWAWIINFFPEISQWFVESLREVGEKAGGSPLDFNKNIMADPSLVLKKGFKALEPVWKAGLLYAPIPIWNAVWAMIYLFGCVAFLVIAWQVFYVWLEFYFLLGIVGIFLPFGFFEPTKFLAEKSISALVSAGIKVMVLSFILTVSFQVIENVALPGGIWDVKKGMIALCVFSMIAYLCWNAPGMAAGIMTGSPSLSAGSAVSQGAGPALAAGAIGAAATIAPIAAAKFAATKGAAMAAGATKAGVMGAAASSGAAASTTSGVSSAGGAATAGSKGAEAGSSTASAKSATSAPGSTASGSPSSGSAPSGSGSPSTSPDSGNPSPKKDAPNWARKAIDAARLARAATPGSEAQPSGGGEGPSLKS